MIEKNYMNSKHYCGKLGWFWDDNKDDKILGMLIAIYHKEKYGFCSKKIGAFEHFEPILMKDLRKYVSKTTKNYVLPRQRKGIEYNKYGCVSGGTIFDQLDKFAYNQIINKYKISNGALLTSSATIDFNKQICDWGDTIFKVLDIHTDESQENYFCKILCIDKNEKTDKIYAVANFIFKLKNSAFCIVN